MGRGICFVERYVTNGIDKTIKTLEICEATTETKRYIELVEQDGIVEATDAHKKTVCRFLDTISDVLLARIKPSGYTKI